MPAKKSNSHTEKAAFLELVVSPRVRQGEVDQIITALAKISDFFGVELIVGNSGGGIPNTLSAPKSSRLGKVHRSGGTQ